MDCRRARTVSRAAIGSHNSMKPHIGTPNTTAMASSAGPTGGPSASAAAVPRAPADGDRLPDGPQHDPQWVPGPTPRIRNGQSAPDQRDDQAMPAGSCRRTRNTGAVGSPRTSPPPHAEPAAPRCRHHREPPASNRRTQSATDLQLREEPNGTNTAVRNPTVVPSPTGRHVDTDGRLARDSATRPAGGRAHRHQGHRRSAEELDGNGSLTMARGTSGWRSQ